MLQEIFQQIIEQIEKDESIKPNRKLSDEALSLLNCVCGNLLGPALDLIDNKCVNKCCCSSGRVIYQVIGSSGTVYTCFFSKNYCNCPSYRYSVQAYTGSIYFRSIESF